jgi:hypothetical protein
MVCWADGSWANRTDGKSQGAFLTAYVPEAFLEENWSPVSVCTYASRKLPRVARSSLAMETQSVATGYEELEYARAAWAWLIAPTTPTVQEYTTLAKRVKGAVITDSKGLYDALARSESSGLGLKQDIRSAIECLALRQMLAQTATIVRWVHSEAMVVDGMTKLDAPKARATTMDFATRGHWRLVQDHTFTAAKKRDKSADRLAHEARPPIVPEMPDDDESEDNIQKTSTFLANFAVQDFAFDDFLRTQRTTTFGDRHSVCDNIEVPLQLSSPVCCSSRTPRR